MTVTPRITPCLWFDGQAEEAAVHYVSIFESSKITAMSRYGDIGPGPKGSVMTVSFILDRQAFIALNGGPAFRFTEAVSMMVNCETQAEVDDYWNKLGEGGEILECGWLKDRFGLSWQIVPTALIEMLHDDDPARSQRVMAAMLQMIKLDLAKLKQAYEG